MLLANGELPEEAADDYSILIEKEKNTFLRHDIEKMPYFGKRNFLICRTASCQKVQRTLLENANDLNLTKNILSLFMNLFSKALR